MQQPTKRLQGFTIIEVLVALALLAIVITAVVLPLTGFFGITRRSSQQVSATNLAQQAIEQIRGEWLNQAKYDQSCLTIALPSSVPTVTLQDEDAQGTAQGGTGTLTVSATCGNGTVPSGPPLRRVTIVTTVSGKASNSSTLVVEVARP